MPQYTYKELKSGIEVTVIRSFDEYEKPPEGDEIPEELRKKKKLKWERQIGANQSLQRGPNWNGAKGYW